MTSGNISKGLILAESERCTSSRLLLWSSLAAARASPTPSGASATPGRPPVSANALVTSTCKQVEAVRTLPTHYLGGGGNPKTRLFTPGVALVNRTLTNVSSDMLQCTPMLVQLNCASIVALTTHTHARTHTRTHA